MIYEKKRVGKSMIDKVDVIERIPSVDIDKEKLVEYLRDQYRGLRQDRKDWESKMDYILKDWLNFHKPNRIGPWAGSSNLHLPISLYHVQSMHSFLHNALFGTRPWFKMNPHDSVDVKVIQKNERLMNWSLVSQTNQGKGIEKSAIIDDWLYDTIHKGWGVTKLRWEKLQRKAVKVREKTIDAITFRQIQSALELDKSFEVEQIDEDKFKISEEYEDFVTVNDGPVWDTIAHEDVLFPSYISDLSDLDACHIVMHRIELTACDIRTRMDSGFFDNDACQKLLDYEGTGDMRDADKVASMQINLESFGGATEPTNHDSYKPKTFEIYECYCTYDIDRDGYDEEVVVYWHRETDGILRWTYLDRITESGKRPFVKMDFYRHPRYSLSMGIPEVLDSISREMDSTHNLRIDAATLITTPFGFYDPGAGITSGVLKIEPGTMRPVDRPRDSVYFPNMPQNLSWLTQEESLLSSYAEKTTGINELFMGRVPSQVGASRTVGGTVSMLNQSGIRIDLVLSRIRSGYSRFLNKHFVSLQENLPMGTVFRVIGDTGQPILNSDGSFVMDEYKDPSEITGIYDFEIIANSASSNRELERQNAILRSQLLLNPILLQLGITKPDNVYNIAKSILEKDGVLNISDYITKPENADKAMTFEEEVTSINQGVRVKVILNDKHDEKIRDLDIYYSSPTFQLGLQTKTINENAPYLYQLAKGDHERMMAVIQSQAQMSNVTGLQIAPSLGAKISGATDPQMQQSMANTAMNENPGSDMSGMNNNNPNQ